MSFWQQSKAYLHSWLGLIKTASVGILTVLALTLANWENPSYAGVSLHPYLVLAVLLAVLQGTRAALFFNPWLAATHLAMTHLTLDHEKIESLWTFQTLLVPIAIVLLPAVVGVAIDRLQQELRRREEEIERKAGMLRDLQAFNDALGQEKDEIGRKLAAQVHTVSRVFEFAHDLETTDVSEIARALVAMVCDELGEDACTVYVFNDADLMRAAFRDRDGDEPLPELIDAFSVEQFPLLERAIQTLDVVKAHELENPGPGIERYGIAAPLVSIGDEVAGVIVVRRLHFLNCLPSTFSNFHSLARWGGMCIGRAKRVLQARGQSLRDEETGLMSHEYFVDRLETLFERARAHEFPLIAVRVTFPEVASFSADQRLAIQKLLAACLLRPMVRDLELVTIGARPGTFHAVFTHSTVAEVDRYLEGVQEEVDALLPHLRDLAVTMRVFRAVLTGSHADTDAFLASETRVQKHRPEVRSA